MTPDSQSLSLLAETSASLTHVLPRESSLVHAYEELAAVAGEAKRLREHLVTASAALSRTQGALRGAAAAPHAVWSDLTALASARSPPPRAAGAKAAAVTPTRGTTAALARAPGVAHAGAMGGQALRPALTGSSAVKRSGIGSGPRKIEHFANAAAVNRAGEAAARAQRAGGLSRLSASAVRAAPAAAAQAASPQPQKPQDAAAAWQSWVADFAAARENAAGGRSPQGAEFSDDDERR
jgi:hypothetical protein